MKSLACLLIVVVVTAVGCEAKTTMKPATPPPLAVTPDQPHSATNADTPAPTASVGEPAPAPQQPAEQQPAHQDGKWVSLFDGQSLKGWKSTEFGGEGDVKVEEGAILLEMGQEMTGITWDRAEPPPKNNYEIRLEARRVDGSDFFCALTFPVDNASPSLVVGGWGGGVVGISSIDDLNASENETTKYMEFKTGQWYKIRVRVTKDRLQAWIDDQEVVDQDIAGRKISNHPAVELSKPLGISTWSTVGAVRKVELRKIDAPEEAKKSE